LRNPSPFRRIDGEEEAAPGKNDVAIVAPYRHSIMVTDGYRCAPPILRAAALDHDRQKQKARREARLCVEALNRRQPVAGAIS
jgi:hypothetical protein